MISIEIKKWCRELIENGDLSEDHPDDEIQKRITRYWELIDMVDGSEDEEVFNAILESIQDEGATEAYESTYNALWKFPADKFSVFFVTSLPEFIDRVGDEAGRFLLGLIGWAANDYLPYFNNALASASTKSQLKIMEFIKRQEEVGWLEDGKGYIKPMKFA